MIKKLRRLILAFVGLALLFPVLADAHVVVSPDQIGVGERQTFSVSVPNEKDNDVTELKLLVPSGLDDVMPTVKPGWQIQVDKTGEGVSAITWSGGVIPSGQRDDFTLRAQAPAKTGQLHWKAYQTYADGSTVSWDQAPSSKGEAEGGNTGPYSVTRVMDDTQTASSAKSDNQKDSTATLALIISVVALVFAVLAMQRRQPRGR